ncbi:MAG: hypothetical protein AAF585_15100 [Verrucomicrobiota bacterium]
MIEFTRNAGEPGEGEQKLKVKVLGVGGAGSNVIDRIAVDGGSAENLVLCNTDVRALTTSIAGSKVQLGRELTMGLGCGGDPELGREAATQTTDEIRAVVSGNDMVFICVGLGGGTGSGAAPVIAKVAREQGCFVVVFTTMPFRFEGRRRLQQANMALSELKESAHALLTFENDRMGELIVPKDGVRQAFAAADKTICQSIRAICSLVEQPGMVRIGMDDLLAVLKGRDSRCLFGFGQASGKDRVKRSVRAALDNPLLDRGQLLSEGANVLVHISGGENLKLAEVEAVMTQLGKHVDDSAQLLFGVSTSAALEESLCVAIISSVDRERIAAAKAAQEEAEAKRVAEEAEAAEAKRVADEAKKAEEERLAEEARIYAEQERVEKERAAAEAKAAAIAAEEAAAEAKRLAEEAEQSLDEAPEEEPEAEATPEPLAAPSVMTVVATADEDDTPEFAFANDEPEPVEEVEPKPVAEIEPEPEPKPSIPVVEPKPVEGSTLGKHEPVIAQDSAVTTPPISELKPPASPETASVPVVKPSIFSIVDETPVAPRPRPAHPKVKIEFAEEDEAPEAGAPAPSPTITLEPPKPSVAKAKVEFSEPEEPVAPVTPVVPSAPIPPAPAPTPPPAAELEPVPAPVAEEPREEFDVSLSENSGVPKKATDQQMLDFDSPSRGRFDKGEPTIVDGEDMDVPTYLRKKKVG